MATKSTNGDHLQQALAILIQNQAAFLTSQIEASARFERIERDLLDIKTILLRHEQMLEALPQAVLTR